MKKFGLLGKNISYSFSPTLHNRIFQLYNIDGEYKIYDLKDEVLIDDFLKQLKKDGILGINITIPYKTSILKFVDEISDEVKDIGAANCIKFKDDKIIAYNTDYFGLLKTFKKMGLNLAYKKVVILGSGGAAKAAVKALLDLKAIVYIVSRDINKASKKIENVFTISYEDLNEVSGYLIINATPVGTFPNINKSPIFKETIQNFDFVLDLIYNPKETLFLKFAKAKNKKIENGLYMLVSQGVKSQEIWNEVDLNYEKVYNDLISEVYK
ncbi:MAG: shikimate dehydrogenase [Cetobacterium sp.]|uniref:shikimate dehydrogenase n=1 Tax=Cetobacterium sp. TaxID=2071632 RepID=UPI003F2A1C33